MQLGADDHLIVAVIIHIGGEGQIARPAPDRVIDFQVVVGVDGNVTEGINDTRYDHIGRSRYIIGNRVDVHGTAGDNSIRLDAAIGFQDDVARADRLDENAGIAVHEADNAARRVNAAHIGRQGDFPLATRLDGHLRIGIHQDILSRHKGDVARVGLNEHTIVKSDGVVRITVFRGDKGNVAVGGGNHVTRHIEGTSGDDHDIAAVPVHHVADDQARSEGLVARVGDIDVGGRIDQVVVHGRKVEDRRVEVVAAGGTVAADAAPGGDEDRTGAVIAVIKGTVAGRRVDVGIFGIASVGVAVDEGAREIEGHCLTVVGLEARVEGGLAAPDGHVGHADDRFRPGGAATEAVLVAHRSFGNGLAVDGFIGRNIRHRRLVRVIDGIVEVEDLVVEVDNRIGKPAVEAVADGDVAGAAGTADDNGAVPVGTEEVQLALFDVKAPRGRVVRIVADIDVLGERPRLDGDVRGIVHRPTPGEDRGVDVDTAADEGDIGTGYRRIRCRVGIIGAGHHHAVDGEAVVPHVDDDVALARADAHGVVLGITQIIFVPGLGIVVAVEVRIDNFEIAVVRDGQGTHIGAEAADIDLDLVAVGAEFVIELRCVIDDEVQGLHVHPAGIGVADTAVEADRHGPRLGAEEPDGELEVVLRHGDVGAIVVVTGDDGDIARIGGDGGTGRHRHGAAALGCVAQKVPRVIDEEGIIGAPADSGVDEDIACAFRRNIFNDGEVECCRIDHEAGARIVNGIVGRIDPNADFPAVGGVCNAFDGVGTIDTRIDNVGMIGRIGGIVHQGDGNIAGRSARVVVARRQGDLAVAGSHEEGLITHGRRIEFPGGIAVVVIFNAAGILEPVRRHAVLPEEILVETVRLGFRGDRIHCTDTVAGLEGQDAFEGEDGGETRVPCDSPVGLTGVEDRAFRGESEVGAAEACSGQCGNIDFTDHLDILGGDHEIARLGDDAVIGRIGRRGGDTDGYGTGCSAASGNDEIGNLHVGEAHLIRQASQAWVIGAVADVDTVIHRIVGPDEDALSRRCNDGHLDINFVGYDVDVAGGLEGAAAIGKGSIKRTCQV